MNRRLVLSFLTLAVVLLASAGSKVQAAVTINFDNLTAGVKSGDAYAPLGVQFTTRQIPNAVEVNSVISLSDPVKNFQVLANSDAICPRTSP